MLNQSSVIIAQRVPMATLELNNENLKSNTCLKPIISVGKVILLTL